MYTQTHLTTMCKWGKEGAADKRGLLKLARTRFQILRRLSTLHKANVYVVSWWPPPYGSYFFGLYAYTLLKGRQDANPDYLNVSFRQKFANGQF